MARLNMASPHTVLTVRCCLNAFPGHFHLHHFSFPASILISFFILLFLPVCCLFSLSLSLSLCLSLSLSLYLYYTPNLQGERFLIPFTGNNSLKKQDAGFSVYKIRRSKSVNWTAISLRQSSQILLFICGL